MILLIIVFVFAMVILLLWLLPLVEIIGDSMYPTLKDGEVYLGVRVLQKVTCKCKIGSIYVFHPPYGIDRLVIKRLTHINEKGDLFFEGDNEAESYDSREYGYVKPKYLVANVKFLMYRKRGN